MGVTYALENHAGFNLENPGDFRRVFERFDSPNLGLCVDVGHFHAAGITLDEVNREFGSRIKHIHLKDNREFGIKEFVPFGEGTADNRGYLETMDARGYDGYAVVEFSPFSVKMDDPAAHRKALEDARAMFGAFAE
jgi:sugar phosphate isomerase/epimerase